MRVINGLDELESLAGVELGASEWFSVDQDMVTQFSELTGDHQWIHLDVERARNELPFGGTIVQGFLTLSLVPRFRTQIVEIQGVSRLINYGVNRVRFPAPVPIPARLRGVQRVLSTERAGADRVRMVSTFVVEIEGHAKPACVAETVTLAYG